MASVEIISSRELRQCPQWQRAFASQHKDSRYYEIVEDTIHPEFEYLYFAVRDRDAEICAIQPFFILDQDILAGVRAYCGGLIDAIRRHWPRFMVIKTMMIGCVAGERRHARRHRGVLAAVGHARALHVRLVVLKEFPASYRDVLHSRHLNEQMVRVLKAIGYDIGFCRGTAQYLYDRRGTRYLDLLSGFGVFAIGRNHPALREALRSVLDAELPNLVQMDVSTLAGILAERLLAHVPYLDKAFFMNSGSETVEAAIKFARAATGRPGIVYCEHAFHGLSYGALSLNGDDIFRDGFDPLLPGCVRIPFNDLAPMPLK